MIRRTVLKISILFAVSTLAAGCVEQSVNLLPDFIFRRETVVESLSPQELCQWQLVGKGEVKIDEAENALVLTEGAESGGITLVSRKTY